MTGEPGDAGWLRGYRVEATLSAKYHIDLSRTGDGTLGVVKWARPERRDVLAQEREMYAAIPAHPNVLGVLSESSSGILLEAMLGDFTALRERAYTNSFVAESARQMAGALAHVHAQGIIHRDVKPGNFLWKHGRGDIRIPREDGTQGSQELLDAYRAQGRERVREKSLTVKLADFGIARRLDAPDDLGMLFGTARYLSPEQARGERVSVRSDVFSLGLVLYTLFTGRPAYGKDATSEADIIREAAYVARPALPRSVSRATPSPPQSRQAEREYATILREAITECTRSEPERRPHSSQVSSWLSERMLDIAQRHGRGYGSLEARGASAPIQVFSQPMPRFFGVAKYLVKPGAAPHALGTRN